MRLPTRTFELPCLMAWTKSSDMPMLSSSPSRSSSSTPLKTSLFPPSPSPSLLNACTSSPAHRARVAKSGFSFPAACDASNEPIVIRPLRRSSGHVARTCTASASSSEGCPSGPGARDGARPDLESSLEVLSWRKTLRRSGRAGERPATALARREADLAEVRVSRAYRLGIEASCLDLLDWSAPMKCHWMSAGSCEAGARGRQNPGQS